MMRFSAPQLCLLLLAAAAAAQARHLQQTTSTRYYGANLYECVVNAGLTTTKQMIDAAGPDVIKLFMNPSLAVTFLAPDNQNWLTWTKWQKPPNPTSIPLLLANPSLCAGLLRNHIIERPYTTSAWPSKVGGQYAKSMTSAGGITLTWWIDAKVRSRDKTWATPPGLLRRYTYRCGGFFPGYDQVGCSMSNLQCGNSIMHVVTDSWDAPSPPK